MFWTHAAERTQYHALPTVRFETCPQARTCMSSALRDVLCACYESGGTDETTGSQLAPKLQVRFCLLIPTVVTFPTYE